MAPGSLKRVSSTDRDISPPATKRKLATSTTNKAVANFFKPASEKTKEPEAVKFRIVNDTLLIAQHGDPTTAVQALPKPVKIAAFDFDDTVIATQSGNRFAKDERDWRWWHPSVPISLKRLSAEGYAVVVMSNQAAVSLRSDPKTPKNGMRSLNNLKGKITAVLTALDLPMTVLAASGHDLFRKPRTGMWETLLGEYGLSGSGSVDLERSVFVGDAAGREGDKAKKVKKDHSCSDRDFASNAGIGFKTPEEFFLDEEPKPFSRNLEPSDHLNDAPPTDMEPIVFTKKNDLDLVLFVGSPGAGKSTYYWTHLQPLGYERVNQDTLKTRDKCMKVAAQHIKDDKKSVVVDNTNADIETRAAWMHLASKLGVPVRVVHFTAPAKLCEHNDTVRALNGDLVSLAQALPSADVDALMQTRTDESRVAHHAAKDGVHGLCLTVPRAYRGRRIPGHHQSGLQGMRQAAPEALKSGKHLLTCISQFEGTEAQKAQWRKYWVS